MGLSAYFLAEFPPNSNTGYFYSPRTSAGRIYSELGALPKPFRLSGLFMDRRQAQTGRINGPLRIHLFLYKLFSKHFAAAIEHQPKSGN